MSVFSEILLTYYICDPSKKKNKKNKKNIHFISKNIEGNGLPFQLHFE